jgi:molybdate transport system ATP-binding protein
MTEPHAPGLSLRLQQVAPIPLNAVVEVAPGQLLVLVGPSGSGKSTLLRCIAGLHKPMQGRVSCDGEVWFDPVRGIDLPPQRRSVGLVFQHYALFPHLSAQENIEAALGHVPPGSRRARARELLATVHLQGMEERRPGTLSGGQQQRVAVARALARDPKVLLLDEPFSAVDQVTRRKLHWELAQLRRALNVPIVLVTHDLEEAAALADVMSILHRGETLQAGPPVEVMARPRNALVARLVDLRNVYEGTIEGHDAERGVTRLKWLGYELEVKSNSASVSGRVCWAIPPANVILHRRDRPSLGERENPVAGVIGECVILGETANVTMLVDARADCRLGLSVPAHVARRNGLDRGGPIKVSLLAEAIHLMDWERLDDG